VKEEITRENGKYLENESTIYHDVWESVKAMVKTKACSCARSQINKLYTSRHQKMKNKLNLNLVKERK
jgi:hypothetical protein